MMPIYCGLFEGISFLITLCTCTCTCVFVGVFTLRLSCHVTWVSGYRQKFLGFLFRQVFVWSRRLLNTFAMSVKLSIWPRVSSVHPVDGFWWNLISNTFIKICQGPLSVKIGQKYRAFYLKTQVPLIVAGNINNCRNIVDSDCERSTLLVFHGKIFGVDCIVDIAYLSQCSLYFTENTVGRICSCYL
jgi:hypothetical protein